MIFKDIQAIHIPEFTIIATVLDTPRISKGGGALKIKPGKLLKIRPTHLGVFKRGSWEEHFIKTEAS